MSSEALALGITFLIHIIGICFLFGLMLREDNSGWRDWWPRDDDDDGGSGPSGPEPGPPLPGADQSPLRLREAGRLADAHRRSPRRPEHAPERAPQRERV